MTDFVINTVPFSVLVSSRSQALHTAVSQLYPPQLVLAPEPEKIYDFCLTVERKWAGWGRPYHVSAGQQHFRMTDSAQVVPVFEWGFNWCIASYQHQYLAIHAAVLERHGKALIMPAPPGSGKSTLCAAMMLEGWRLLSDEMCLVDLTDGSIVPCVRPVSLKNQSLKLVQSWYPSAQIRQITTGTTKGTVGYLLPLADSWQARGQTATAAWVVFPQYNVNQTQLQLSPISKADAFMHLANNSFNYAVLAEHGFNSLGRLTQQIQAYRLEYADIKQALSELSQLC
ncbi:HprK-related kinase A [Rheinheimera maricola]|uniref:HprK-related kinase A n=1 Tax=Rheinheimera maricola TaxID=2793282 RepID=A0ABS7XBM8_9GAMM|nr:HprK-related kinase A [Rheinheimera maricola]MBZ9612963.1 HprK-related kinase A [Rheinheimera maricola]